jgi:hypothetical protein
MSRQCVEIVALSMLCATGCATKIETHPLTLPLSAPTPGIVVFVPQLVKITYEFKTLVDGNGNVLGTAPDTCVTSTRDELKMMPDFNRPMALVHKPSAWASTKFSVTLSDGMLTGMNTESDAPAKEIAGAVTSLLTAATPLLQPKGVTEPPPSPKKPLCNAAPAIARLTVAKVE